MNHAEIDTPTLMTTTTCRDCGNEIPESLLEHAQCVRCRYAGPAKRDNDDLPPSQVEVLIERGAKSAWTSPPDGAQGLLAALVQTGATFPNIPTALDEIENAFDLIGDQRGADTLAFVFSNLPGGKIGTLLRQALLGTLGGGVEAAQKHGVTKQTWFASVRRLRARILKSAYCVETHKAVCR